MATCRACGAPIRFVDHEGKRIALDAHEVMKGEKRFLIGLQDRLLPVTSDRRVLAYQQHVVTCPYKGKR